MNSPFKMAPKSPLMKALKGNQHKLPQHLQEAIKAAPESPAKQVIPGWNKSSVAAKEAEARKSKKSSTPPALQAPEAVIKAVKKGIKNQKDVFGRAGYDAKTGSPAKQTTYGEFMYEKSLKDKEMGKSTKVVDKLTSALEAPFSDKTYAELKKEKRAAQKKKYAAKKSPAKKYKK